MEGVAWRRARLGQLGVGGGEPHVTLSFENENLPFWREDQEARGVLSGSQCALRQHVSLGA